MAAPFRIVPLPPGLVAILPPEAGDDFAARSIVVRRPDATALDALRACAECNQEIAGLTIFFSLAGLDLASVEKLDPRVRSVIENAVAEEIEAALADVRRAAS